jgi:hypothetical protein
MFPVSVKISAIISLVKFAQAFQIHPVSWPRLAMLTTMYSTLMHQAFLTAAVIYPPNLSKCRSIILGETRR